MTKPITTTEAYTIEKISLNSNFPDGGNHSITTYLISDDFGFSITTKSFYVAVVVTKELNRLAEKVKELASAVDYLTPPTS